MAPIRTAIVGLSSSAKTSWASNTHLQYLNSPLGRSKYQIVALQNSSLQAAKNAIVHYNLPPETKAYGTPEDLAGDKDVELVVVATRVDVHHSSALPSVKAGKDLYVEWPLAQDVQHARELVDAAREKGVKTIVGLQGRYAPPIKKLREIIEEGRIGKVVSAELYASGGTNDREILPSSLEYFTQRAVGGNIFTIGLGHIFDQFQSIIGDITNFKSTLHNQRPNIRVRDPKTNEITHTTTSNVPDLILATGRLSESSIAQKDAAVLVRFRRGQPFPGSPHLSIAIAGEKGEIRVQVFTGTTLHGASAYEKPVVIEVHDFERDVVEQVEWKWEEWQQDIPLLARGVAAVYEAFAGREKDGLVSFEEALKRHQQLEGLLGRWDEDRGV
ncbi:related to transcription co-repressor GAL80 [Fusarium fujikuroi]|uniref:Related to transcription co-repressor GAL80 n=1 Tax=Gibberella fujikuroi (strain CBS 195.34 / IMI 58289 / NRRL A-6831) TaxID=1279085 RepID=S0DSJ2_GIBF5|nr:related to transcription co-repressor GAL80 [Fusarium fujikuroi IMI 58289]KLO87675.1 transcription co-repressor GAL80 [Fusarium fujikuroi]CCT65410.1 related to transcription co-repressor GAL80 [Fusarium fujikuroi IMI 58289]SCN68663.1 related to transcription co-repressor GAL80 [Fusarium fujikuroi]SCO24364.1 related to transcription co-repressor GAL80 [Fusarium fujikuroi]SCO24440.1 related to transcription co-repressor GAL80 [Fusarium fujikuroi]